jgi:hypothetical protein
MLTASAWGPPPTRYYRFLRQVKESGAERVAVLGCSDGRFVMGFARAGMRVSAIDIDPVALWGGKKAFPEGEHEVLGLKGRLEREGLSDRVRIHEADFVSARLRGHDAVFTSGALHYSFNKARTLETLGSAIVASVRKGGLIYADYMLPVTPRDFKRANFPRRGQMREVLTSLGCTVVRERYSGLFTEKAHVEQPRDHVHSLGYVLARRN